DPQRFVLREAALETKRDVAHLPDERVPGQARMALTEAAVAVLEHDHVRALEPGARVADLDRLDLRVALDDLLDVGPARELGPQQAHVRRRPPKEGDLASGERLVHPDAVGLAVRNAQPRGAALALVH